MDPDRFAIIKDLFEKVCDLPKETQEIELSKLCKGDQGLHTQVSALLEADEDQTAGLDALDLHAAFDSENYNQKYPESIGSYSVVGILGRGGTSVVYEATQRNPSRSVALKVFNTRSLEADALRRFEKEAQIMGRISHPCIAKIYESGIVEGRHGIDRYIAMEIVRGLNLIEYARNACHKYEGENQSLS